MEEFISALIPTLEKTVLEYGILASKSELSEQEAERMDEILIRATNDSVLAFWLDEVDHCLGHQLGLLDEASQVSYKNQQVMLQHLILEEALDESVNVHTIQPAETLLPPRILTQILAQFSDASRTQSSDITGISKSFDC